MQVENMNLDNRFKPQELCSRKLWQLINSRQKERISESELHEALTELTNRRHYLSELEKIGKLGKTS